MKVHQTNGTAWESLGVLVTSQGSCPAERAECKHFERHIHHHVTTARWLADADRTGPGRLLATQQHLNSNAQDIIEAFCPEKNAKCWSLISSCDVDTSDLFLQLILLYYWLQDGAQVPKHVAVRHCHVLCLMIWNYFINPLNTNRRPLYLKPQSVPRCKHFSSLL